MFKEPKCVNQCDLAIAAYGDAILGLLSIVADLLARQSLQVHCGGWHGMKMDSTPVFLYFSLGLLDFLLRLLLTCRNLYM